MSLTLSQKNGSERFPIDTLGYIPSSKINKGGQNIHPTDHGTCSYIGFNLTGPANLQRHPCSIIIEIPLAKWPLPTVIAGKKKNEVLTKFLLRKF